MSHTLREFSKRGPFASSPKLSSRTTRVAFMIKYLASPRILLFLGLTTVLVTAHASTQDALMDQAQQAAEASKVDLSRGPGFPVNWVPRNLLEKTNPSFAEGDGQVDSLKEIESELSSTDSMSSFKRSGSASTTVSESIEKGTSGPLTPVGPGSDAEMDELMGLENSMSSMGAVHSEGLLAQANSRRTKLPARAARPQAASKSNSDYMSKATALVKAGQYPEASKLLFLMSRNARFASEAAKIKYILGLVLSEMKFNQVAAFVLYDVVHQERGNPRSPYLRKALGKLAMAADALESDALLRYAIRQVGESDFPADKRDMLSYRLGESKLDDHGFLDAARDFNQVRPNSIFFLRARYKLALAYAENNDPDRAVAAFDDLINRTNGEKVTDVTRVAAELGKARALYQKKDYAGAIEAYHVIPRDTEMWHEALFESSWAMFMDGRFRSALGNFHSLHSAFYEDFYQPESLLLRAIVYLYICRYEEMDKVLQLFERVYKPAKQQIYNFVQSNADPTNFWRELSRVQTNYDSIRSRANRNSQPIPFLAARFVLKEPDVRHSMNYIAKLDDERKRLYATASSWQSSGIGAYSKTILEKRLDAAHQAAGKQIRSHLITMHNDLRNFFEQGELARYEMLSGRKETIRKELTGKSIEHRQVDEGSNRSFYIQNGYEYWPFQGEYWLDEIGNYHYVGVKACE